jgi:hypothetical protein
VLVGRKLVSYVNVRKQINVCSSTESTGPAIDSWCVELTTESHIELLTAANDLFPSFPPSYKWRLNSRF